MFTVKKTKEGLIVDPDKPHSTMDVHFFLTTKGITLKCGACNKPLEDGQVCGHLSTGGKMVVEHERCP